MKRFKKLLLPLSLLPIVPITTIPVVACSQTSNKDNVAQPPLDPNGDASQPTPPSPSNPTQPNINRNYALSGEFAKYYTKAMFEENIKLFEKFDGSNKVWINEIDQETNKPIRYWYQKNYTCLKFQAYGNIIEIKYKVFTSLTPTPTPNNWVVGEHYIKFEYISSTEIKQTEFLSGNGSSSENTPTTKIITMNSFYEKMHKWTPSGWKDFITNGAGGEWED